MQPIKVTVGPLGSSSTTSIAANQVVSGAAAMTLTASPVTLYAPQRVGITCVGNDSGITFTIVGTTFGGQAATEVVQGVSGSLASSTIDFATVSSITTSGSTSGSGASAGPTGVGGSRWVRLDSWANAETSIQCNASGTVNYTVQVTMDDPNDPTSPVSVNDVTWINTNDTDAVSAIGDVFTNFQFTPTFARVLLNSGNGSVTTTFAQFNVVNK